METSWLVSVSIGLAFATLGMLIASIGMRVSRYRPPDNGAIEYLGQELAAISSR